MRLLQRAGGAVGIVACIAATIGRSAAAPVAVPGVITAAEFTDYEDIYIKVGPVRNSDNALFGIVTGERAEYEVTVKEETFFKVTYAAAADPPKAQAQPLILNLVVGKTCKKLKPAQVTNTFEQADFITGSYKDPVLFEADGFLLLPAGTSTLSLCFQQAFGVVVFNIVLAATEPVATPDPAAPVIEEKTPRPDTYKVPGSIMAVGCYEYRNAVDEFRGEGYRTGPGRRELGFFGVGERALYTITAEKTGNYELAVWFRTAENPPGNGTDIKVHFALGVNTCAWGEFDSYYPTVELTNYKGTPQSAKHTASNNVLRIPEGSHTLTMCVDYASYVAMQTIDVVPSSKAVITIPVIGTATLFNSAYITLFVVMGAGALCGLLCLGHYKVKSSRQAAAAAKKLASPKRSAAAVVAQQQDTMEAAPSSSVGPHPRTPHGRSSGQQH